MGSLKIAIQEQKGEIKIGHLPVIRTDPTLLAQVFQNLIANALKFHKPEQPPIVDISATSSDGKWIFSVRDNGLGIEQKYQHKIFLMFYRLHGRQEFQGSGIGLAACKEIIERLGGQIWLQSQPGTGSNFLFSLPFALESTSG